MTTTYTFEQLKEDVRKEAEALRVHATSEERGRLDIRQLYPKSGGGCIYGLLTGYCHSDRAVELIEKCCVRYFKCNTFLSIADDGFSKVVASVMTEPVDNLLAYRGESSGCIRPLFFSAIEAYILLPDARNANLIAYLRGETETLEL